MLQGDQDWRRLAEIIADEDRTHAIEHNAMAFPEHRLQLAPGPTPCLGAVATAPVVMLLSHPAFSQESTAGHGSFCRPGWPLAALHPDAPPDFGIWWRARLVAMIDRFGAQHVSNAVAAVFLTPWASEAFDHRLRLPSRRRMLDLARSAALRDAMLLVLRGDELWTEQQDVAALPPTRLIHSRSRRSSRLDSDNLGDEAWEAVCQRVASHAWL